MKIFLKLANEDMLFILNGLDTTFLGYMHELAVVYFLCYKNTGNCLNQYINSNRFDQVTIGYPFDAVALKSLTLF